MCLLSLLCYSSLLLYAIVFGGFASCMLHVSVLCVFMMILYYDQLICTGFLIFTSLFMIYLLFPLPVSYPGGLPGFPG